MTQTERVIAAARSFRGTCQADWLADITPDEGPRITRVAARIQDAEEQGCVFEIIGVRGKCRVYRLVSAPIHPGGSQNVHGGRGREQLEPQGCLALSASAVDAEDGRLFSLPAEAHYSPRAA